MIPWLALALIGCRHRPVSGGAEGSAPPPADGVASAPERTVTGPGEWRVEVPGRAAEITLDVPAGFVARTSERGLVAIEHVATRAVLRVDVGTPPADRPGFLRVFTDDGGYRAGPGASLAGTETWASLDLAGPTLVVLVVPGEVPLWTELEIPVHAELIAWRAFAPIVEGLRLE